MYKKRAGKYLSGLPVILLLAAGLSLLLYPTVSNWVASRNHSRAIVDYALSVEELTSQEIERQLAQARAYNAALSGIVSGDAFSQTGSEEALEEYRSILNVNGMIGYVSIPSIDVYLPVYHTVTGEVLRKGVGHMPGTAFPIGGEGDHAVLTAHRGLPSAKLFTDLNRLEEEDVFYLHILGRVLCYRVDQIVEVEPFDTGALQPLAGVDNITLVTCTPYAINSHRLLVRGSRVADLTPEPVPDLEEQLLSRSRRLWKPTFFLLSVAGVAICLWIRRKQTMQKRHVHKGP